MSDINCPYCDANQDINHDDGYGYEENVKHEQRCSKCGKYFTFTTHRTRYYEVQRADCLNGSEHKWRRTYTFPIEFTDMECDTCDKRRKPDEKEMAQILGNKK